MKQTKEITRNSKFKNIKELIKAGWEWFDKRVDEGWCSTPCGLLSQEDIKKSGMILKDGQYVVPTEQYIAENDRSGYKKGQKYLGVSQQFLKWHFKKYGKKDIESMIDKEGQSVSEFFNKR